MSELKYDVVKFVNEEFDLSVNVSSKEQTIWLSLDEMSLLFERDRSVIGKHIRKIYQENELNEKTTRAKNARHLNDGRIFQAVVYNLDVIIGVGYRENLKRVQSFTSVQKMHIGNSVKQEELQFRCKKIQCNYLC